MHDNLWNKALQENPEPERLYPVLAVGFGDLQVRSNAQKTEASRQLSKAAELSKKLADLHQKHDLSNAVRAHSAMMMQNHSGTGGDVNECSVCGHFQVRNVSWTETGQTAITLRECCKLLHG